MNQNDPLLAAFPAIHEQAQKLFGLIADAISPRDSSMKALVAAVILPEIVACPDSRWHLEMTIATMPCGKEGCQCHEQMQDLMFALDAMRTWTRKELNIDNPPKGGLSGLNFDNLEGD